MRAKRILRITAGIATSLLAVALGVAFTPSFQTWAARRILRRAHGTSVERFSYGIGKAEATGIRVEMDGSVLLVPRVDADVGILAAALGGVCHIRSLEAKGWTLDLAHSRTAATLESGTGQPLAERLVGGVVAAFRVPAGLSLDGVDLEGDVIFPDAGGRPAGRAHVTITGGGLGAGRDGRFFCGADAVLDDPAAPVSSVAFATTVTMSTTASGVLSRGEMRVDATAAGRQFPGGIGLTCAASGTQEAGRQTFSVSLIRGTDRLAELAGVNPGSTAMVSGTWRLDLRDTDLAPFALGRVLPAFYVAGRGDYGFDASTGDVLANGKFQATVDRLGVIARPLDALGRVVIAADFDMARTGDSLRVSRLDTSISGDSPVGNVRALQSFEFKPSTGELKVAVPSGDLVGISVKALPLAWLKGLIPQVDVAGNAAAGEFVMRAEDGRIVLRTRAPFAATGVSVSRGGNAIADDLEVSAFILGDYALQGWQMQCAPFEVRRDGTKIISLEARFGSLAGTDATLKAAGSWSASVPALLAMPVASGLPRLAGGDASGNFEASLDSTRSVRLTMALANLAPPAGEHIALPAVTTECRADIDAAGNVTFSLPLRLDFGTRVPDVVLAGTVRNGPDGPLVEASLSGKGLSSDDLGMVAVLSGGAPQPPPAAGAAAPAPVPAHACWPNVRGRLTLQLDELSFPRADLKDLRGVLRIDSDSLAIDDGSAGLGGGSAVKFSGKLAYDPGQAKPYSFKASLSVDGVDSAPFFTAANAGRAPAVEGKFAVNATLSGSAPSPGELPAAAQGEAKLSSRGGVVRVLHADVLDSIKQDSSRIADALDTVTALFGKKGDKMGTALVETAKALSEIHYDQMNVTAERGDDLDLRITQITVLAPEERLTGTGRISYAEGVELGDQALSVDLSLGVRGRVAKFMDVVGLLGDAQDDLGYTGLYQPIHLGGTLRAIDQSQWKEMLVQAPLRKGGGLFDKLLGR
jgi:hypothetical protein